VRIRLTHITVQGRRRLGLWLGDRCCFTAVAAAATAITAAAAGRRRQVTRNWCVRLAHPGQIMWRTTRQSTGPVDLVRVCLVSSNSNSGAGTNSRSSSSSSSSSRGSGHVLHGGSTATCLVGSNTSSRGTGWGCLYIGPLGCMLAWCGSSTVGLGGACVAKVASWHIQFALCNFSTLQPAHHTRGDACMRGGAAGVHMHAA
jgi:hypothetical protein